MQELWLKVQYTVYPQLLFNAAEEDPAQLNSLLEHKDQLGLDLNRPNPTYFYDTPLMGAFRRCQYRNVMALLEAGANPNILNEENCSLVVSAISHSMPGLFRALLWYNVDFDLLCRIPIYSTTVDAVLKQWIGVNHYDQKLHFTETIKLTLKKVQEAKNQEEEAQKALKAVENNQSTFANYLRAINAYTRIAKIFYHESEIELEVQTRVKFPDYTTYKALQPVLVQHYQKKALQYYLKAHECCAHIKITALSQRDREHYTALQEIIGQLAATLNDMSLSNTHYELAAKQYCLLAKEAYMADKKEEAGKYKEKAVTLYQNLLTQPTSSQKGQFYHLQLQTLQQMPILCAAHNNATLSANNQDVPIKTLQVTSEFPLTSSLVHRHTRKEIESEEEFTGIFDVSFNS